MHGLERIDSLSELRERLARGPASVVLGDDDEAHREYYIAMLSGCAVGICSQGHGIVPSVVIDATRRCAWVGYNSKLTRVDIGGCCKTVVIALDSVFYAILCVMQDGSVIGVHELGAIRVSSAGAILWRVSSDVVTEFADGGDALVMRTEDENFRIDKESGLPV